MVFLTNALAKNSRGVVVFAGLSQKNPRRAERRAPGRPEQRLPRLLELRGRQRAQHPHVRRHADVRAGLARAEGRAVLDLSLLDEKSAVSFSKFRKILVYLQIAYLCSSSDRGSGFSASPWLRAANML